MSYRTNFINIISYSKYVNIILKSLILLKLDFICEGVVLNLNLDNEKYAESDTHKPIHNSLVSVFLHDISFRMISEYFESRYSFTVNQALIEHHPNCAVQKANERIKEIYNELISEDQFYEQVVHSENLASNAPPNWFRSKSNMTNQEYKSKQICENCRNSQSKLSLNFQKEDKEQHDLLLHVSVIDEEYQHVMNKDLIQTEIGIVLANMTYIVNPSDFKRFRLIIDYAQLYTLMKRKKFKSFMKEKAFWPEVDLSEEIIADDMGEHTKKRR